MLKLAFLLFPLVLFVANCVATTRDMRAICGV